jgi:hypothetical protein
LRCPETTILFPANNPIFLHKGDNLKKHWQKYNKTITTLCVRKHPDLSTLGGVVFPREKQLPPQVDKSGCFPTQRAVIVYCSPPNNPIFLTREITHKTLAKI